MGYVGRMMCLLCDSTGTLRRLKPEKLYACKKCIDQAGGVNVILAEKAIHMQDFRIRNPRPLAGPVVRPRQEPSETATPEFPAI